MAARVFVGVQLVVRASAQHQLRTEKTGSTHTFNAKDDDGFDQTKEHYDCKNSLTPLSVHSTQNTLSSWAARSYSGALQLRHKINTCMKIEKRQTSLRTRQRQHWKLPVLHFTWTKTGNFCCSRKVNMSGIRKDAPLGYCAKAEP